MRTVCKRAFSLFKGHAQKKRYYQAECTLVRKRWACAAVQTHNLTCTNSTNVCTLTRSDFCFVIHHPQLICGMSCPADRWLVTSQAVLHPGPITALILLLPPSSLPSALSPCVALQPESAQLYSSTRPARSVLSAFTRSTASAAAPAIYWPSASQAPVIGIKSAKWSGSATARKVCPFSRLDVDLDTGGSSVAESAGFRPVRD